MRLCHESDPRLIDISSEIHRFSSCQHFQAPGAWRLTLVSNNHQLSAPQWRDERYLSIQLSALVIATLQRRPTTHMSYLINSHLLQLRFIEIRQYSAFPAISASKFFLDIIKVRELSKQDKTSVVLTSLPPPSTTANFVLLGQFLFSRYSREKNCLPNLVGTLCVMSAIVGTMYG